MVKSTAAVCDYNLFAFLKTKDALMIYIETDRYCTFVEKQYFGEVVKFFKNYASGKFYSGF